MTTERHISRETLNHLTDEQWAKLFKTWDAVNEPSSSRDCVIIHGMSDSFHWGTPSNTSKEMTYKELINFINPLEEMKFVVHTHEQAAILQKKLFKLGYTWKNGQEVTNTGFKFFATTKSGGINCYYNDKDFSKAPGNRYVTKVTVDFVEAETIEINGVTYLKEDVEKALASISPL